MPFAIKGKLSGLDDVFKRLSKIKRGVGNRILRKAIGEATKPILRDAKAKAAKQTGLLRKSLGRKVKVYRTSGVVVGLIGPRSGFKKEVTVPGRGGKGTVKILRNPIKYAHLVEKGTTHSAAKPFLSSAWAAGQAQAVQTIRQVVMAGIEALAK